MRKGDRGNILVSELGFESDLKRERVQIPRTFNLSCSFVIFCLSIRLGSIVSITVKYTKI